MALAESNCKPRHSPFPFPMPLTKTDYLLDRLSHLSFSDDIFAHLVYPSDFDPSTWTVRLKGDRSRRPVKFTSVIAKTPAKLLLEDPEGYTYKLDDEWSNSTGDGLPMQYEESSDPVWHKYDIEPYWFNPCIGLIETGVLRSDEGLWEMEDHPRPFPGDYNWRVPLEDNRRVLFGVDNNDLCYEWDRDICAWCVTHIPEGTIVMLSDSDDDDPNDEDWVPPPDAQDPLEGFFDHGLDDEDWVPPPDAQDPMEGLDDVIDAWIAGGPIL